MENGCIRHTEIPHTSKLFSDYQYHFDRVAGFYAHNPADPTSYRRAVAELSYPDDRRAALVAALRAQNEPNPALDELARPGTVAVVTGQQVGLFSGPAYTIYKALTAASIAARLRAQGLPAVPVFWLATEDHDIAEVDHTWVFDRAQQPVRIATAAESGPGQRVVGPLAMPDPPIAELERALAGLPFAEEVTARVRHAYRPGVSFGDAFRALMRSLLEPFGFVFVDPLDPDLRRIAGPFLRKALDHAPSLKQSLLERNQELADVGYHAQVHIEPNTSLFFLLEDGQRITLRRANGGYVSGNRNYSVAELDDVAEQVSPNALLRPVMQDYLLPSVAYVGGPAELAYMAQSQVLYRDLLGRMPVIAARSTFTLIDQRGAKLLDRYKLHVPDVLQPEAAVRESIAARLVPAALHGNFETARREVDATLETLACDLKCFDPTLGRALGRSRRKIEYQLAKMQDKTARQMLRRDERAQAEAAYLTNLIYPQKHLQERFYSILPFLARHGSGLLDTLYENVHLDCPDHKVVAV